MDNANAENRIVIGQGARGLADDSVVLGNADVTAVYMAQDSGATVYAAGLNLSGGTTVSGILSGTLTWSDSDTEQTFTVSGVTSSSVVTVTWKKNDNVRTVYKVVPGTNQITVTLNAAAVNDILYYIVIN